MIVGDHLHAIIKDRHGVSVDVHGIGDLNALCSRDADCQRYMLCSGMDDGTRRCHCQTLYSYDIEQKRC
ncbi:unnamed protein product, partial [Rotaria magnacalcarata]